MSNVYNHSIRVKMYARIRNEFGPFDRNNYTLGTYAPRGTNIKSRDTYYNMLRDALVPLQAKEGLRAAKSGLAVANQVCWCTGVQTDLNAGQLKIQRQNRLAAYEAGFVSMGDIVWLENESVKRHKKVA